MIISAAPMVKFLREHLEKFGCSIGENFIKSVQCDELISGGYVRGEGVIIYRLCHSSLAIFNFQFSFISFLVSD